MANTKYRTNYVRRSLGLTAVGGPVCLLVASAVHGRAVTTSVGLPALAIILVGLLVEALNSYLSFAKGLVFRWRTGSVDGYRRVSGIPVLGTVLATTGGLLGFGSVTCAVIGLLSVAIDTGGSIWLVISTWRDASFWDSPRTEKSS